MGIKINEFMAREANIELFEPGASFDGEDPIPQYTIIAGRGDDLPAFRGTPEELTRFAERLRSAAAEARNHMYRVMLGTTQPMPPDADNEPDEYYLGAF